LAASGTALIGGARIGPAQDFQELVRDILVDHFIKYLAKSDANRLLAQAGFIQGCGGLPALR